MTPTRVHHLLDRAAARHPGTPSVRDDGGWWTHADLHAESRAAAGWLRRRGVRPGDRVAVVARSRRPVVATLFACSRIGASFVPLGPAPAPARLAAVLADLDPAVVLHDGDAPADGVPPGQPAHRLPDRFDGDADGDAVPDDRAGPPLLMCTSGSAATPRAVVCPAAPVLAATRAIGGRLGYRHDDVVLGAVPLSFDYGLYQVLLAVAAGARLVLHDGPAAGLVGAAARHRATVVPVVPATAAAAVALARRRRWEAPTVRLVTTTGEAVHDGLRAGLRTAFPAAALTLMYGTTECKRVTVHDPDGDLVRPGSVGRPLPGVDVAVVDPRGRELPAGRAGEIVVRGPLVMGGYWRDPDLTAAVFRRGRGGAVTLHTGDHGHLDAGGHLHVHGRRDDVFAVSGVRIGGPEIEAAATAVDGVRGAVVLRSTVDGAPDLVVAADVPAADVLHGLARRLGPERTPRRCRVVPSLPVGPHGKVDRRALQEAHR